MDSPADNKQRLNQIQTQDLTESRVNDDFVLWLKKHGMNTLLAVLIAACAVMGYQFWQRKGVETSAAAWADLSRATLPEALEQLAKDHADLPQVAIAALLQAGDLRLRQVQSGVSTAAQGTTPAVPLDDAARKIALDAADENYSKAAQLAGTAPGAKSNLVVMQALFGRAAVAESRGDLDASRKYLAEAEGLAGTDWSPIAKLAKTRIDGLVALATPVTLPKNADLPAPPATTPATPAATGDDLFQNILQEQGGAQQPAPATPPANPPANPGGM
jgi:predicted negative regulator of RcsB-dependent stress response